MKRFIVILVVLGVVGALAYVLLTRSDPNAGEAPALAGAPASALVLARGEYLTRAADCIACHTIAGSDKPYAGGVAFKLPFGTIYSSNITADPDTGIGTWSDEDFVRAVREGVRKDGEHLYPAFPYTSYTELSRSDVLAIKAYLFSLPKIHEPGRRNDLGFPFNQRWAMGFWNAAFFESHRFTPDASKSAQWNSGAYLANALGHCGECHTPRNFGFALEKSRALAGEELQGWRAYNLSSDPAYGLGSWSDAELTAYLRTGHADGRGSAAGPMGEAIENSLQYLSPDDTAALIAYLRTVAPQKGSRPVDIDPRAAPALASSGVAPAGDSQTAAHAQGVMLFEGACASCHEWNGSGLETPYASLLGTRGVNDPRGINVTEIILEGAKFRVGDGEVFMPAFGNGYSNTEVAALANYVIEHFGNKTGEVTPDEVRKRRTL